MNISIRMRFNARIAIALSFLVGFSACYRPNPLQPTPSVSPLAERISDQPRPTSFPEPSSTTTTAETSTPFVVQSTTTPARATLLVSPIDWTPENGGITVTSHAPDGSWTAETIFSEARLSLHVTRKDGGLTWLVIDKKGPLSIDYPFPSQFRWSSDGRYLYFYGTTGRYYYHPGDDEVCDIGGINVDPQRMDLESGEIVPLTLYQPGELEEFSISSNTTTFAYFDPDREVNMLTLRNLETGGERHVQFDVPAEDDWVVGEVVWAPDESALAFAVVASPCNSTGVYPTSFIVVDLNVGTARKVISDNPELSWQFEWLDSQVLLLHDKNGISRRIDVKSGTVAVDEQMPLISPDEGHELGWLTFIAEPDGYPAVYAVRADGSGLTQLSGSLSSLFEDLTPGQIHFGDWSPDGSWFTFEGSLQGGENDQDIFIARTDGSSRLNLTDSKQFESQPDWSPDGQQIVFLSQPAAFNSQADLNLIAGLQTNGAKENLPTRLTNTSTFDSQPSWSPDGSWIAFVSSGLNNTRSDLYVIRPDGSDFRQLTNDLAGAFDLAWSPDGELIAFISDYEGDHEVYFIDSDGTDLTQVTKTRAAVGIHVDSSPTWSSNQKYIAYLSTRNEKTGIYIARVDGTGEWLVIETPAWAQSPHWSPLTGLPESQVLQKK